MNLNLFLPVLRTGLLITPIHTGFSTIISPNIKFTWSPIFHKTTNSDSVLHGILAFKISKIDLQNMLKYEGSHLLTILIFFSILVIFLKAILTNSFIL